MTTVNDLLVRTARDLNDYTDNIPNRQFQRWTKVQLLGYWNEALCVMFSLNPSKFKCAKVSQLKPGINQVFAGCKRVLSVIGVSDKDGDVLYEIEEDKADKALKWGVFRPRSCPPTFVHTRDFKLTHYRIATEKDGSVFVKPAVPYGKEIYLKYMCETPPEAFDITDLDEDVDQTNCSDVTFGIHWVLFRALMVDEESQSSTQLASQHLQLFLRLLEVKTELDKETNYNLEGVPAALKQYVAREIAKYQIGVKA